MSRLARRRAELPFTLFSFQDIMASVTGVVILVTLMLMLELAQRPTGGAPQTAAAASTPAEAAGDAARLGARVEELRSALLAEAPVGPEQLAEARRSAEALRDLLRVLEAQAKAQAAAMSTAAQAVAVRRAELTSLASRVDDARRQAEVERTQTRVTLLEGDRGGKRSWLIECGEGPLSVGRIGADGAAELEQRFTGGDAADALLRWAIARPKASERFVLLVRPDGVAAFDRLQRVLRGAGYDVGWDLWTAEVRVFPEAVPTPEAGDGSQR